MRYWLGLGSNLGDRRTSLQAALSGLAASGVRVREVSPVYSTAPRDVPDQPEFLNAAAVVDTDLAPLGLLDVVKRVETELGRAPGPRSGPRRIDCDLLLWEGGSWEHERLSIPHPRLATRRFALVPLIDLDPGLTLPDGRLLVDVEARLDALDQPVARADASLAVPPLISGVPSGGPT